MQKKNLRNDILKRKISKFNNIPIIYIWETEIKTNIDAVKEKIKRSIEHIRSNPKDLYIPEEIVKDYYANLI
jgi:intergrase/recombinase